MSSDRIAAAAPVTAVHALTRVDGRDPTSPSERRGVLGVPERTQTQDVAEQRDKIEEDDLKALSASLAPFNVTLEFSKDEETGVTVAKIVDATSGETLRQIPEEARLRLAAALAKLQQRLVDRMA